MSISLTLFKFLARGTYRHFIGTEVIICNKLDNYFFVSADRQTFLGFEMATNLRDSSFLSCDSQYIHVHVRYSVL